MTWQTGYWPRPHP